MKQKSILLASTLTVILILDQWTKALVHHKFQLGESYNIIPGFFDFTYVRNTGAAFGFLQKAPSYFREPFFMIVPLVIVGVILNAFIKLPYEKKAPLFGYALVFSGAIGNMIDRLKLGFVVDFVDVHYREIYHWPAFNIADSAIVVGVFLLLVATWNDSSQS